MKSVHTKLVLVGCITLGFLLPYAQGAVWQDTQVERSTVLLDPNQRIAQIGRSATVILTINTADRTIGNGSGFFIRQDLLVTNVHVLAGIYGESYIWEATSIIHPTQYAIKGVVASDPEHDLLILRVEGKETGTLQLADSDTVKPGEKVIAVGTHRNRHENAPGKIREGTISRITDNFFRVKATLPPGYSGGPVLNSTGEVVGICVEGGETKNSGYVIPSNHLSALLRNASGQEKSLEEWWEEPMIRAYALANRGDAEKVFGNAKNAIEAYDAAVRLMPDFAAAYAKRGSAHYHLRDYKASIKDHTVAIRLGLDYAAAYVNRGVGKRSLRNYKGAIEDYDMAIRLDPENVEAYLNRGNTRSDMGNYKTAIEDYSIAIRLKPRSIMHPMAYFKRASAKSESGDKTGAIEDYDEAVRLKPNNPSILTVAHLNRGLARFDLDNTEGAIEDYDEVIRLSPKNALLASAYVHRADAKSKLGDNNGAIKDYDEAARLIPEDIGFVAHVYSRRAATQLTLGDNTGAIEDCDAALLLDPDLAEVYKIRGEARWNLGNHNGATKDYDAAVYLRPDDAEAYYKRGRIKIEVGKVSEAKADFRTALKLAKWTSDQALIADIEEAFRLLK